MNGIDDARTHELRSRAAAERGEPAAMATLGWARLQQGDLAEAELWYSRAADAGVRDAMTGLGNVLKQRGERDQALGWWRRAAGAGDVHAMRNLARFAPDRGEAKRWTWFVREAERDVAAEAVPDEVVSAAHDLGTLRSVAGPEAISGTAALVVWLVLAGVIAGIGLLVPAPAVSIALFVAAAVVAVLGVVAVHRTRHDVTERVWRFDRGLVHRDVKNTVQVLRWPQVRVHRHLVQHYKGPHPTHVDCTYTLAHDDGRTLRLTSPHIPADQLVVLGDAVERAVTAVRLPVARAAVQAGRLVAFGPLTIDATGIGDGRAHLPWAEVEAVDCDRGWIQVKRAGRWLRWGSTQVKAVPDVMTFLALADGLRAGR